MNRFATALGSLTLLILGLCAACTDGQPVTFAGEDQGSAHITVFVVQDTEVDSVTKRFDPRLKGEYEWRLLRLPREITRLEVEVQPANIVRDISEVRTGQFEGTLVLPIGNQTFTARAFTGGESDEVQIGEGSAQVAIETGVTAEVQITVYDSTGSVDPPVHAPVITLLSASKVDPVIDEEITLEVTAIDPDDDELTYSWSDDCDGTFGTADQAQTTWSNSQSIACTITVAVSDGEFEVEGDLDLTVYEPNNPQGTADVAVKYQANPYISSLGLGDRCQFGWSPDYLMCMISEEPGLPPQYAYGAICRQFQDATCSENVDPETQYYVQFATEYLNTDAEEDSVTWTLTDDCGGTSSLYYSTLAYGSVTFNWTTPSDPGLCMLTATVEQFGLTDSVDVAVLVVE